MVRNRFRLDQEHLCPRGTGPAAGLRAGPCHQLRRGLGLREGE